MPVIQRTALLPYPAASVFGVVDDVARYPDFLPWCTAAAVLEETPEAIVAELALSGRGVHERFITRNLRFPHERIELHLVQGPFRSFTGTWTFAGLGGDAGCRVTLGLDFELSGTRRLVGSVLPGMVAGIADRIVDAFCARARALGQ
jgi:ribosome-associated toxin RatA of RatAB toxin-antitoxin module